MQSYAKYKVFRSFLKSQGKGYLKEWVQFKNKIIKNDKNFFIDDIEPRNFIDKIVIYDESLLPWEFINTLWQRKCTKCNF